MIRDRNGDRDEERGMILERVNNLTKVVEQGFSAVHLKFDSLDCKDNTKIINELKIDYTDRKLIKQHIAKTIISKLITSITLVGTGATAVWAGMKIF